MPTIHDMLLDYFVSLAAESGLSFDDKSKKVAEFVGGLNNANLSALLGQAGFIPERYPHDSSEEKVYAKAMDILVATSLQRVGYETAVSVERSNSADVTAICASGQLHTVALDAKAFRLSRTALNPKDYKIEALNTWRKGADFASLVGPLAHFPEGDSRLYEEAIKFNVTLLTFSHLQFVLEYGLPASDALVPLWNIAHQVRRLVGDRPTAKQYWLEVDSVFCAVLGVPVGEWKQARRNYFSAMLEVADQQIAYYEAEKARIRALPRNELLELAVKALKVDNHIGAIAKKKQSTLALLQAVEEAES